jgi:hypothetical protein
MRFRAIALFCGLMFMAPTVAAGAVEPRPANVVQSFYAWYFSPSVNRRAFDHLGGARQFMTKPFWELLARVRPYEQVHGAVLDADPFIDAQIEASSVSLGSSFTFNGAATVTVVVHYPKDPSAGHVKVMLVRTVAGWRIDDVAGATGGSVRKALAHTMK